MKTLFDVMDKLEENGYSVEYDDCITWLDIESANGHVSMKPIFLSDEQSIDIIESFIIPDFADNDTKEMNIYLESYPKRETIEMPNAIDLYNTIVEWLNEKVA